MLRTQQTKSTEHGIILSGSVLTDRELDNIFASYADYGPERLGDFIRSVWREAYDEAHDVGYISGKADGYNLARRELKK